MLQHSTLENEPVEKEYVDRVEEAIAGKETWKDISDGIRQAAEATIGRKSAPGPGPASTETQGKIKECKEESKRPFDEARTSGDPEQAMISLRASRAKGKEHRYWIRKEKTEKWNGVVERLEDADRTNNWPILYRELKTLGLYHAPPGKRINFKPEELRNHFAKIGHEVNEVSQEELQEIGPRYDIDDSLGVMPEEEEISTNLTGMKETAPGPDEVTTKMLVNGGLTLRKKIVETIRKLWDTDPEDWEAILHEAEVIALPKKGDITNLGNYRGICLLQVISRLLARIVARRLSKYLEKKGILATDQWGFRPLRSAVDALFVLSRVVADASRVVDMDPVVMDMMDIKKAYPNCARNAMEESLKAAGVPVKMKKIWPNWILEPCIDADLNWACRSHIKTIAELERAVRRHR
jgi:hypothetical protein